MVWFSMEKYAHSSLNGCLEYVAKMAENPDMKEEKRKELTELIKQANESVTESQKKFLKFLEKTYSCSGLCKKSLFYITLDISNGRPKNTCTIGLINSVADQLTLFGYTLFFTGCLIFLVFILMMPLCCYNEKKLEQELKLN